MIKELTKIVTIGIATAAASFVTALRLWGQDQPPGAEIVPLEFTRIMRTFMTPGAADGTELLSRGAHRSDGSWTISGYEFTDGGAIREIRTIFDLQAERQVTLDSHLRSTTTYALPEDAAIKSGRRPACDGETASSILGYDVVLRRTQLPYSSGEHVQVETYFAPELGCLELEKRTTLMGHDGEERAVQLERVVDVRLGEPADDWFKVPTDYSEMSPEEVMRASNPGADLGVDKIVQNWERDYQIRKAPSP